MNPTFYWATVALTIVVVIWRSKKWQGADWAWAISATIVAGGLFLLARLAEQLAVYLGLLAFGKAPVPEWLTYSMAAVIWVLAVLLVKIFWPLRSTNSKNGSKGAKK